MDDAIRKAECADRGAAATSARFRDRLIVIKLGGSAMEDPDALDATLQDVVFMATVGLRPVLVHGGGKPIDRAMAAAGLVPRKVQGRRYTDEATLDIVVRVLIDEINADIVRQIRRPRRPRRRPALAAAARPVRRTADAARRDGQPIDLGHVGAVTRVDTDLHRVFCAGGVVPVIPSLACEVPTARLAERQRRHRRRRRRRQLQAEKLVFLHRHARHPAWTATTRRR